MGFCYCELWKRTDYLAEENEIVKISVIHFINNDIKFVYSHFTNYQCFNFFQKTGLKHQKWIFFNV
jgi:hypothetical protein